MKQFLKKFRVFRLTAIVEACAGLVSIIASIVALILYQTNQYDLLWDEEHPYVNGFIEDPISGMVFFLAGLGVIILGVITVYAAYPFIVKKDDKREPNRLIPWFGVATGVVAILETVYVLIMRTLGPDCQYPVGLLIVAIVLILSSLVQFLMIIPTVYLIIEKE